MTPAFVHLNVHTQFSMSNGLAHPIQLAEAAARQAMPALALTDIMNLFGLIKFYQACISLGLKPIIGAEILLENKHGPPYRLTLLCQNKVGYQNLCELISQGYLSNPSVGSIFLKRAWLAEKSEGLILLSGERAGDVGQAWLQGKESLAHKRLIEWKRLFPNRYYLELRRIGHQEEASYISGMLGCAKLYHLPVVATNAVQFLHSDDFSAHEARVAIHEGTFLTDPKRSTAYTPQQYLRSADEMQELFSDIPSALSNTVEIAKRCNVELSLHQIALPHFPVPNSNTVQEYLSETAQKGLSDRLSRIPYEKHIFYRKRMQDELAVIVKMGFEGYFLIVADFIQWARKNKIPVGPGRGSGAGSLVAYALSITDLDPIEYDLLFERFLNPERVSMPDFDIDFCIEGRDRVIEYVTQKYGHKSVSQIITYGTLAAKAVIRDVGRVLGHPYGFVDKLAKLIPFELGMTLEQALKIEPLLRERYEKEEEVSHLIDLAKKLEGVVRNVSTHAGGVVIAPSALTHFMPIYREPNSLGYITQFDKDDLETLGLIKFDFLGLRTLTIIDWTLKALQKKNIYSDLNLQAIPLNDSATFALLKAGNTRAIFQLESRGMRELLKRLQPDHFEEIVALVALFRPGPLQSGMVEDFINRKHGRAKIEYLHPQLEPILRSTYGVILYQEQVMQIAQVLAGYTLGHADLLRRAMGKKKPKEMAQQRLIFIQGAEKNGIDKLTAIPIFNLIEKFAGYGFNKSHSVAYALLTYQTAWLKAHYAAEFVAAVMSTELNDTDKLLLMLQDCKVLGIKISAPSVNRSTYKFFINETGTMVYGLGAVKGVGEAAVQAIIEERERSGPFMNLFDFCQRIDTKKVNRRALEALIKSGAMDDLGLHRAALFHTLDLALKHTDKIKNHREKQTDLFGSTDYNLRPDTIPPWSQKISLAYEKEALGLFLSGHPFSVYLKEFESYYKMPISELKRQTPQRLLIMGIMTQIRLTQTKKGEKIAFFTLDDSTDAIEVSVFNENYEKYRALLSADALLVVEATYSPASEKKNARVVANKIYALEERRAHWAKQVTLELEGAQIKSGFLDKLKQQLKQEAHGTCALWIDYIHEAGPIRLETDKAWHIQLSEKFLDWAKTELGENKVKVSYA